MDLKKRGDLVINGFGASGGGQFHLVMLNGFGTINSDVECSELECNGFGTLNGNLKSDKIKVNGKAKFKKNIESQSLAIDGTAKIDENLFVQNIKVSGKASVGGKVKSEELIVNGSLTVEKDCEAETFKVDSQFKIGGLLNADQIKINMFGPCKAKEIGGQTIIVRKHKSSFIGNLLKPFLPPQLETELVEGDKIDIEHTDAKIVRGNHIKIGPNCNIGLIEYTDELVVDDKSIIGESRKV